MYITRAHLVWRLENEPDKLLKDLCKFRSDKQADRLELDQAIRNLNTVINLCIYRVSRLRRNEKELNRLYDLLRSDDETACDMEHDSIDLPWHEFALELDDINADKLGTVDVPISDVYKPDAVEDALAKHEWDKETP